MKRFCSLLLALLLLAPLAAAEDDTLARVCGMARLLDEVASSETYISLMTGAETITAEITAWGAGDHDAPTAAYAVTLDAQAMMQQEGVSLTDDTWSEALRRQVEKRMLCSIPSLLNSRLGTMTLAASSVCQMSASFACNLAADTAYILLYRDATPVMVCLVAEEDGVVSATAAFLAGEAAASMATAEDVAALLDGLAAQVEPVALP